MFFRLNTERTTTPGEDKVAGLRKFYANPCARPAMFLRFARFRFREGKEAEGLRILRGHAKAIRASPGCRDAWLGQGQHPATECVVIALFEEDRKSTRLNSSHTVISYAVFCLKKKRRDQRDAALPSCLGARHIQCQRGCSADGRDAKQCKSRPTHTDKTMQTRVFTRSS